MLYLLSGNIFKCANNSAVTCDLREILNLQKFAKALIIGKSIQKILKNSPPAKIIN
jgi:hypothetical protein